MSKEKDTALRQYATDAIAAGDTKSLEHLVDTLRWKADQRVINDFDEDVWLKPFVLDGKRIGITECCFADNPCERHKRIAEATG